MSTTTVCFRIDPEWLTDLLRKLWLEKEYGKAFKIVDSAFPEMPVTDKLFIVTGKKKLVYAPGSETEFVLEGDDWAPSGAYKGMHVATFADVLDQSQLFTDNKEALDLFREVSVLAWSAKGIPSRKSFGWTTMKGSPKGWIDSRNVIDLICRLFPAPTAEQWNSFWEKYGDEVEDIKREDSFSRIEDDVDAIVGKEEDAGKSLKRALGLQEETDAKLASQWGPATATNMEVYLAHCRELDSRPTPPPDTKLEHEDGWVLPDGKFYPCGYMEHIWLAEKLGKPEREAEKAGWVKISHGLDGTLYIHRGERDVTQKQINTVFDWCTKHRKPLPHWAGGKDNE